MAAKTEERTEADRPGLADQIAEVVLFPVEVARRVLPERGAPVYLGIGALAVLEVIEWPVAVATGAGYFLLQRWRKQDSEEAED